MMPNFIMMPNLFNWGLRCKMILPHARVVMRWFQPCRWSQLLVMPFVDPKSAFFISFVLAWSHFQGHQKELKQLVIGSRIYLHAVPIPCICPALLANSRESFQDQDTAWLQQIRNKWNKHLIGEETTWNCHLPSSHVANFKTMPSMAINYPVITIFSPCIRIWSPLSVMGGFWHWSGYKLYTKSLTWIKAIKGHDFPSESSFPGLGRRGRDQIYPLLNPNKIPINPKLITNESQMNHW